MFPENSYGMVKRLLFIEEAIRIYSPKTVLDIGCGNGFYLTSPLASRFPGVRFLGIDIDRESILQARLANSIPNLEFSLQEEVGEDRVFDLVIASEVIEHSEEPGEFIESLKRRLKPGGKIFLSMPNANGAFEISCFIDAVIYLAGIRYLIRTKRAILSYCGGNISTREGGSARQIERDTCAVSPHINFFSYRSILCLIEGAGLRIIRFAPRVFLCGPLFDRVIRSERWISWNASVCEKLPEWLASGWMFLLEKDPVKDMESYTYRRSVLDRVRREISVRRLLDIAGRDSR